MARVGEGVAVEKEEEGERGDNCRGGGRGEDDGWRGGEW